MALEIFRLVGSVFVDTDEADKSLKKSDKDAESLGKRLSSVAESAGKFALGVVGAATAAGTALVAVAENTREYRTEQGKLQAAFETSGFAAGEAKSTYEALNGVLGDNGQAVEAANHLAKLCDNTEELQSWTKICTGVYATFGASLPIEGLTEAANETAKVGQVTGPLADALNWAGVSEDAFNEKLKACTSEQQRQALITRTLNGLYSDAADKYREVNAEVIAANMANEKLSAAMAGVGAAVEPVITLGKTLLAEVIERSIPYIEILATVWIPAFIAVMTDCGTWISENSNKIVEWTGYIVAATVGVSTFLLYLHWGEIMAAASKAVTLVSTSIKVLNATITKNPIGLLISLITSLIAYIGYLYATNEEFRAFADAMLAALWAKVQVVIGWIQANVVPIIQEIIAWLKENAQPILEEFLAIVWAKLQEVVAWFRANVLPAVEALFAWIQENAVPILGAIMDWINQNIMPVINVLIAWLGETIGAFWAWLTSSFQTTSDSVGGIWETIKNFFKSAWDFIVGIWEACQPFFQGVWDGVIMPVAGMIEEMIGAFKMAWDVIKLVWDYVKPYFEGLWEAIKAAAQILCTVLGTVFKNAWEAIKLVWSVVSSYFATIWEAIKAVFSVVATYLGGLFKTAWEAIKAVWDVVISYFTMVWAGIKAVFAVVKGVLSGDFSDAWEAIKNLWNKAKAFFQSVWSGIKNVFSSVGSWFGNTFKAAWEAVKKVFSSWGSFFSGLWDKITDTFSAIGTNISNAISKSVKAGLNGVISSIEGIINSGVSMINGAIRIINKIPGVSVGSLSYLSLPRLARGGVVDKPTVAEIGEDGAEAVVPLERNTGWIDRLSEKVAQSIIVQNGQGNNNISLDRVLDKMDELLDALQANQTITLNKREFARIVKEVG